MLGRDTEWRQGHLLSEAHAARLDLGPAEGTRIVVATHDCDLANDHEPEIELLVGKGLDRPDGILENARNPRRLHLTYSTPDGRTYVEVSHASRCSVSRDRFVEAADGVSQCGLEPDQKRSLKQWLAARYGRPAFPNAFETRLRKQYGKEQVEKLIGKAAKPEAKFLVGIFFDLGEDREAELVSKAPYFLSISVVYEATEGGPAAREAAERTAEALTELFHSAYGNVDAPDAVILERCSAMADTAMTLADLRKVDQWRLEYVSLAESPIGSFVGAGDWSG